MSSVYENHYNEKHLNKVSSLKPSSESSEYQRLHKIISMIPSGVESILDCGCGDGRLGNLLKDKYSVHGCDIAQMPLKLCKFPTTQCRITELPFADNSFDLVICGEVLEHILPSEYEQACRQMERIASKWILVTVPNREDLDASKQKCPHCGTIFHPGWHVRCMDENKLSDSFPKFLPKNYFYVGRKRRLDQIFKMKLRNRLIGYPTLSPHNQCLFCGCYGSQSGKQVHKPISIDKRSGWYKTIRRWALAIVPGSPQWLGVVLERKIQ